MKEHDKKGICRKLKSLDPQDIPAEAGSEIAQYISDTLDLPQGTDLNEAASAVRGNSPELGEMLDEIAQSAWMPSKKEQFDPAFRQRLIKALSKLALIPLALLCLALPAQAADVPLGKAPAISNDAEAMTAYDSGKFAEAGKYYASRLVKSKPSAQVLYNMGNCLYKLGDLPKALICYERAMRLAPRDSDILENLNLVRRKLGLPEKYLIASPADVPPYLRDALRPDEWMLMLAFGIALVFIGLGIWRLTGKSLPFRILLVSGAVLTVLSAAALISQENTVYDPKFAIVTEKLVPVYTLPSETSGRVEMKLRAGESVTIGERRQNWVRIRSGNTEGWVPANSITSLWTPHSISTN